MRYLLINDTSSTNNPGCQATVAALMSSHRNAGSSLAGRIALGEGYECFAPFTKSLRRLADAQSRPPSSLRRMRDRLFGASESCLADSLQDVFDDCVEALSKRCENPFADCELVVINGEGTLHHDRTGSYLLLGWAALAKRQGLPVSLVNCTIQSFHPVFFSLLNRLVDWLAVREPCSLEYVRPFYPRVRLAADAIFAEPLTEPRVRLRKDGRTRAAYTPGVLSYEGEVNESTIRSHLLSLRRQFDDVEFLTIEVEDQEFEAIAAELGCAVHSLGSLDWKNVEASLAKYDCLISGRYHVCIFGLRAGVPVVPLHSNTWKMRGLMRFRRSAAADDHPHNDPLGHDTQLADVAASLAEPERCSIPMLAPQDFDFEQLSKLAGSNVASIFTDSIRADDSQNRSATPRAGAAPSAA